MVVAFDGPVVNVSADDLVLSAGTVVSVTGSRDGPYVFEVTGLPIAAITATLDGDIADPVGTFYRFSLPDSMLRRTQS